jgi:UDP-N-acetylmuramoyl-L-alanyl-D-glutamate--2,6-diaminopimelate ligase
MTLRELFGDGPDVVVTGLTFENRLVAPGTLFFCVPGFTRDGHDFAPDAVARGAVALVAQRPLGLGVPEILVDDVRAAMAGVAARFYGDPTAELSVAGITGTNGKTTTAFLARALLEGAGIRSGLLGTVKSVVGGEEHAVVRTTPEAIDLQRTFREMLDAGDVACAIEISSHALELRRADAIHVAAAVFTNLTQDHLDFHPTMEDYFRAKRLLFASRLTRTRIANADDPYGRRLIEEFPGTLTFAIERAADYRALDVRTDGTGCDFVAVTPDGEFPARVPLPGRFNVLNALAAWAAARALGAPADGLASALATAATAPGRFQPVAAGQPFGVVVDYAHKPAALEQVLLAARELASGRLIVVVGAGGDRDRGKRPMMGEIAARLADVALITSDNPRSEPPEAIIDEIVAGIPAAPHAEVERDGDRRASIFRAIGMARPGDVVVLAGKGHEQGQEFEGGRKEPFDDSAVAREAIAAPVPAGSGTASAGVGRRRSVS